MNRRGEQESVRAWARAVLEPTSSPALDRTTDSTAETRGGTTPRALAGGAETCREAWASLELPPAAAAPPGFAPRVARAWSRERESAAPVFGAPWMRAAAAAALFAGVVLGGALSGAGDSGETGEPGDALVTDSTEMNAWEEGSLSEEYLAALGGTESALVDGTGAGTTTP